MGNTQATSENNIEKSYFDRFFNIIPDLPDNRDLYYQSKKEKTNIVMDYKKEMLLIPELNINQECNLIYNLSLIIYLYCKESKKDFFFPYINYTFYNSVLKKNTMGNISTNSCLSIRNCLKAINYYGLYCQKGLVINSENIFKKPNLFFFENAKNTMIEYQRIKKDIKSIILAIKDGNLILFNYSIYNSFLSEKTQKSGHIFCPENNEKMIGMKSSIIIGINEEREELIIKFNSSKTFGEKGIGYMPYNYIEHNCSDLWIIDKQKIVIKKKNNNLKKENYIYVGENEYNDNVPIQNNNKRRII